ncbi:hypothetical protein BCR32DRAFT_252053 [Anaeromyces robustus]|uniref:Uncharacterized protein n=1 Tax=Anaeromyces robustus TaxID=1754192 RepID=A0A1Y1UJA0_9FUNG|nr:hypothetical protein BCR32DRAFT_252053 [Anaeromyces robustus]|eukprot:ORX38131.1 hypothetical protein BCR32DRAFT_252053 [Anaeromyces robustus]
MEKSIGRTELSIQIMFQFSCWFLTTNFVIFHPKEEVEGTQFNYSKYKFYFIDQDFDQTLSIGADVWKAINHDNLDYEYSYRVIVDKFLGCDSQENCQTKELFNNHLKSVVQHIFDPVAIKRLMIIMNI